MLRARSICFIYALWELSHVRLLPGLLKGKSSFLQQCMICTWFVKWSKKCSRDLLLMENRLVICDLMENGLFITYIYIIELQPDYLRSKNAHKQGEKFWLTKTFSGPSRTRSYLTLCAAWLVLCAPVLRFTLLSRKDGNEKFPYLCVCSPVSEDLLVRFPVSVKALLYPGCAFTFAQYTRARAWFNV